MSKPMITRYEQVAWIIGVLAYIMGFVPLISNLLLKLEVALDTRRKISHNLMILPVLALYLTHEEAATAYVPYLLFGLLGTIVFMTPLSRWVERSLGRPDPTELGMQNMLIAIAVSVSVMLNWDRANSSFRIYSLLSIFTWSIGDASASIIGKRIGTHKYKAKSFDHDKTLEGSVAFFVTALFAQIAIAMSLVAIKPGLLLLVSANTFLGASIEAISTKGSDSITVPICCSMFFYVFGSVGC